MWFLLTGCMQLAAQLAATSTDSECVRYETAVVDCAKSAGLDEGIDPEAECEGAADLDYTCMADFVASGDCSDANAYELTVDGVWDACPSL
jgi:hypothetical protein